MGKIINFDDYLEHAVTEALCINCKHRWIAVFPIQTLLKNLECPNCGEIGYVISTGQDLSPNWKEEGYYD